MKTFPCLCGNTLFFGSVKCVQCERDTGMCPICNQVVAIVDGKCTHPDCGASVGFCGHRQPHFFCNRMIETSVDVESSLCGYCELTVTTPDLTDESHRNKWRKLERAKQRVLYIYHQAGFPIDSPTDPSDPPLTFIFAADGEEQVLTGHASGVITVNIREADSVERERARVNFGEPQRTLVGHFRHELGHYVWERMVLGHCEDACRAVFGDERDPLYGDALKAYYAHGPKPDWKGRYISAYATMHPWEDFAETFGAYMDMHSVLATSNHFGITHCDMNDIDAMIDDYRKVGLIANEFNRDMGLLDLVPEVFVPEVIDKMRFVDGLR